MPITPEKKPYPLVEILESEGLILTEPAYWLEKSPFALNKSIDFFKHILDDNDSRWAIVLAFEEAREQSKFSKMNFENALQAVYLSRVPSYRNEYSRFTREPNLRQLCRAIQNVACWPDLKQSYQQIHYPTPFPESPEVFLAKTNKLTLGTDSRSVTGCPEALYQLQMFDDDYFVGRIGFNVHVEGETPIISIANIQGIPDGKELYDYWEETFAFRPFNYLVRVLKVFSQVYSPLSKIRGLKNSKRGAGGVYNRVLKAEGIKILRFTRVRR